MGFKDAAPIGLVAKHGTLDWKNPTNMAKNTPSSKETPAQTMKRLERELED